jgi:D-sedoheptulose 7-phosphate isomerase
MNKFILNLMAVINNIKLEKLNILKNLITNSTGTITILGNGGSNAIASHIAEDYTKALKKISTSFSDGPRLTCYANDYGYENAFKQFLFEFSDKNGLVILISSSGNSKNILNCAQYCVDNQLKFIILSGFEPNNKLRNYSDKAELDFWVDSKDYGIVECAHEIILHSII